MIKYYLNQNVFDAAIDRIRFLFDEFDNVIASTSGGKDSTIIFHLCHMVAQEKNRPLYVFFLDQEAEYRSSIDIIRGMMTAPGVIPIWAQVPFRLANAASNKSHWLHCWDPAIPDQWMRQKESYSLKENIYGTDRFVKMGPAILKHYFKGKGTIAQVLGMRSAETPKRTMALTNNACYKWVTWGSKVTPGRYYTFNPIYDWGTSDIWAAIHRNRWPYNRMYDYMFAQGHGIREMRVSSLIHETAIKHLINLHEFEADTYNAFIKRIPGVSSIAKMSEDLYPMELPYMFSSWREYRDHLHKNLVEDTDHYAAFQKLFNENDPIFVGTYWDKKYMRACVRSIIANDHEGTMIMNQRLHPKALPIILEYFKNKKEQAANG